jgi:hypothetical protein
VEVGEEAVTTTNPEKALLIFAKNSRYLNTFGDPQTQRGGAERSDARFRFPLPWFPLSKAPSLELGKPLGDLAQGKLGPSFLI